MVALRNVPSKRSLKSPLTRSGPIFSAWLSTLSSRCSTVGFCGSAGAGSGSTPERLSAAEAAGTLDGKFARALSGAFELFQGLLLEHQVNQIQRGIEPDDYLDPTALYPARRRQLRDAFREVRAIQKRLGRRLSGEIAFA